MAGDYPGRRRFATLTAKEKTLELLNADRPIGRRDDWLSVLDERGISIQDHQVTLNTH